MILRWLSVGALAVYAAPGESCRIDCPTIGESGAVHATPGTLWSEVESRSNGWVGTVRVSPYRMVVHATLSTGGEVGGRWSPTPPCPDFDGNGRVDLFDLSMFMAEYQRTVRNPWLDPQPTTADLAWLLSQYGRMCE